MKVFKGFIYSLLLFLSFTSTGQVEMANDFRGEGKIYVVIFVIITILLGFFYLLFKLDRRTKRLEKEMKQHED